MLCLITHLTKSRAIGSLYLSVVMLEESNQTRMKSICLRKMDNLNSQLQDSSLSAASVICRQRLKRNKVRNSNKPNRKSLSVLEGPQPLVKWIMIRIPTSIRVRVSKISLLGDVQGVKQPWLICQMTKSSLKYLRRRRCTVSIASQ